MQTLPSIAGWLAISNDHPWLAATPDGWVEDPQATPFRGLVEFKNPHSCRSLTIDEAIATKKCTCLVVTNGRRSLKTTHNFYYQIQFAIMCFAPTPSGATSFFEPP